MKRSLVSNFLLRLWRRRKFEIELVLIKLRLIIQKNYILVQGNRIPLQWHVEKRKSIRFSIGKRAVICRIPIYLKPAQVEAQYERLESWLLGQLKDHPGLLNHLTGKIYKTGDEIAVGNRTYTIQVDFENRKTMACQLKGNTISMKFPKGVEQAELPYNMKRLLSHAIGKDYLPTIRQRIEQINQKYFKQEIRDIKLKYNASNWGSCNRNGVITLSTRLLFAPTIVIDYVIIHELAHLLVFDHSARFWAIVKKVMPNYKEQEKWLKDNYFLCDFA